MNRIRKTGIYTIYEAIKQMLMGVFFLFPIQSNKVVFDNFGGKGYGDDPKYIAEQLRKDGRWVLIWMVSDKKTKLPEHVRGVKYGTFQAAYHWATAAVWVDNIKNSRKVRKKRNQYYIQTWHSTLGLKMNEQDAPRLSNNYIKKAVRDAAQTDLMYADNDFRMDKYRNRYWYRGTVIKCDVPRMSILFECSTQIRKKVYASLKIPMDYQLVLYAPTFRQQRNIKLYEFHYQSVVDALERKFKGHYKFLIRLHPNEAVYGSFLQNVTDVSGYDDMQELLAVAQVLITDYSGCMFDFGFVHKPVFLYAPDYDYYLQFERQNYFKPEELPFAFARKEEELLHNIENFSWDSYLDKCKQFEAYVGFAEQGNGARILAEIIREKLTCMGMRS